MKEIEEFQKTIREGLINRALAKVFDATMGYDLSMPLNEFEYPQEETLEISRPPDTEHLNPRKIVKVVTRSLGQELADGLAAEGIPECSIAASDAAQEAYLRINYNNRSHFGEPTCLV